MDKNLLSSIFVGTFMFSIGVFMPTVSNASSGACSYHGGVNCSVTSSEGNAVCNDGFESSTSYASTDECKLQCPYPTTPDCSSGSVDVMNNMNGIGNTTMAQGSHYACESQHIQYLSQIASYNSCINTPPIRPIILSAPKPTCPLNSSLRSNGDCHCDDGYANNGNDQCITYEKYCADTFGQNVYAKGNSCYCNDGYSFSSTTSKCDMVPVVKQVVNDYTPTIQETPTETIDTETIKYEPVTAATVKPKVAPIHKTIISTSTAIFTTSIVSSNVATSDPLDSLRTQQTKKETVWDKIYSFFGKFKFW